MRHRTITESETTMTNEESSDAYTFWEARYASSGAVWSGRVNTVVREVAESLRPGSALDLGCGEGGDAVWLASRGWETVGVDLSDNAVERARAAAARVGLDANTVRFFAADLSEWTTAQTFNFVTSAFLHSWPAEIPRSEIVRRSKDFVAPGGSLLVVAHAAPPPWADAAFVSSARFPTPEGDLAAMELPDDWQVDRCELNERGASGPGGQRATLIDSVVLARRPG